MSARSCLVLMREYGAKEFYVVLSLADLPENTPTLAFSLKPAANLDQIKEHTKPAHPPQLVMGQLKETLVLAMPPPMKRLKDQTTVARPDLAAALQGTGDAAVQVAAAIPADVQRVIRELLGKL